MNQELYSEIIEELQDDSRACTENIYLKHKGYGLRKFTPKSLLAEVSNMDYDVLLHKTAEMIIQKMK